MLWIIESSGVDKSSDIPVELLFACHSEKLRENQPSGDGLCSLLSGSSV